jgi:ABC-type multidrug transport system fused ATPase/permease subunit
MIKFANWNAQYRGDIAHATDERVRHIGEIIEGIASVKSYAWENPFFEMIGRLRRSETSAIKKSQWVRSANQGLIYCTPGIVSFITFVVYWRLGGVLTIPKVFATMSLLQVMRTSVGRMWTRSIELTSEAIACSERIQAFLDVAMDEEDIALLPSPETSAEQVDVDMIAIGSTITTNNSAASSEVNITLSSRPLISIRSSGYFYGDDEKKLVIEGIDFDVSRGEILMIVGAVGSGKSSLLSAVLGEMKCNTQSGKRTLAHNTKIAYCAQRPWVVAATVKANVTIAGKASNKDFKHPVGIDEDLYKLALESSLLIDDLHRWPAFDSTEIGEKGLSISGGQKARVSLARAVYSDADCKYL